ncbi:hypothetical protein ACQP00_38330 [Dactylosporangium sp. CS-047395]|uniref:hypothetical protein n=1 Tax=Dactylosporangium sp. CS-047395 TaxID=3239936 RepID=UPI003D8DAE13
MRVVGGADRRYEQDPAGQAHGLHRRGRDAEARDPRPEPAAGPPPEHDADRGEQDRTDHQDEEPAHDGRLLHRAIAAANTSGDLRITATARLHLARILRTSGLVADARDLLRHNAAWYRTAGGGDGALLTRCLLADSVPELEAVLAEARATDDRETQVHALDALARRAEADALAATIPHLIDEADRLRAARPGRQDGKPSTPSTRASRT